MLPGWPISEAEAEVGSCPCAGPVPRVADGLPGHRPWQAVCFPFLGDSPKTAAHFLFKNQEIIGMSGKSSQGRTAPIHYHQLGRRGLQAGKVAVLGTAKAPVLQDG